MADAAKRMVDDRPGEAEQDDTPDDRAGEPFKFCIRTRRGGGDEPPGQQQCAEVIADARDAMDDRHRHRQRRLVDL